MVRTARGRSVFTLAADTRVSTCDDIPRELLEGSLSAREIVLPYPEVIGVIHRLPGFGLRAVGWEGWLRYPDGRLGHSARRQGTADLSGLSPAEAAAFCIRTIEEAHTLAAEEPEEGELCFCVTVASGRRGAHE